MRDRDDMEIVFIYNEIQSRWSERNLGCLQEVTYTVSPASEYEQRMNFRLGQLFWVLHVEHLCNHRIAVSAVSGSATLRDGMASQVSQMTLVCRGRS